MALTRDHDRAERDEQQPEREQEHEAEDLRHRLRLGLVEVRECGRSAGDRVLDAVDRAERRRQHVAAEGLERAVGRVVRAVALERDLDLRDGAVTVGLDVDRRVDVARGERLPLELGDRLADLRGLDVVGLDRPRRPGPECPGRRR